MLDLPEWILAVRVWAVSHAFYGQNIKNNICLVKYMASDFGHVQRAAIWFETEINEVLSRIVSLSEESITRSGPILNGQRLVGETLIVRDWPFLGLARLYPGWSMPEESTQVEIMLSRLTVSKYPVVSTSQPRKGCCRKQSHPVDNMQLPCECSLLRFWWPPQFDRSDLNSISFYSSIKTLELCQQWLRRKWQESNDGRWALLMSRQRLHVPIPNRYRNIAWQIVDNPPESANVAGVCATIPLTRSICLRQQLLYTSIVCHIEGSLSASTSNQSRCSLSFTIELSRLAS